MPPFPPSGDVNWRTGIKSKVPLAELLQYATSLRSMTQGRGHYSMEVDGYEAVPSSIRDKLLERL